MPIVTWDGSLTVGHEMIDQHHEHLVGLLNKTYDSFCDKKSTQSVRAVLDELVDYATYHFSQEEQVMDATAYPEKEDQVRENEYFIRRIGEIKKDFATGTNPISLEIISFLKNWLVNHISQKDIKLGTYIRVRK